MISASPFAPRLTRLAILAAAGAATLSLAACGSSNTAAPAPSAGATTLGIGTSSGARTSAHPGRNGERVAGLITSVSGGTIQVTQKNGTATMDFTPSTAINQVAAAGLTDVTAGGCVSVRPTRTTHRTGAHCRAVRADQSGCRREMRSANPAAGGLGRVRRRGFRRG